MTTAGPLKEATAPARPDPRPASAPSGGEGSRLAFVDLLRVVASTVIVWHHLALYGPLSDIAYPVAPGFIDFFYFHGRLAVAPFFVIGGFLAARGLREGHALDFPRIGMGIVRRYVRIGGPYLATLAFAIAANELASRWMVHESISAPPSVGQVVAHALFLHNLLGYESLTAGIWYLAIDFQLGILVSLLFAAGAAIALIARRFARVDAFAVGNALFGALAVASLVWFNRVPELDVWAIYFFGSFYLGMVLQAVIADRMPRWLFWAYLALVVVAGAVDWRPRLLLAAATALAIYIADRRGFLASWPRNRVIAYLGRISFSLFLIHFPVCLLSNAVLSGPLRDSPIGAIVAVIGAYLASIACAITFHHGIEAPCVRLASTKRRAAAPERGVALSP